MNVLIVLQYEYRSGEQPYQNFKETDTTSMISSETPLERNEDDVRRKKLDSQQATIEGIWERRGDRGTLVNNAQWLRQQSPFVS